MRVTCGIVTVTVVGVSVSGGGIRGLIVILVTGLLIMSLRYCTYIVLLRMRLLFRCVVVCLCMIIVGLCIDGVMLLKVCIARYGCVSVLFSLLFRVKFCSVLCWLWLG